MVSFRELLTEGGLTFYQYKALVRITYNQDKEMHLGAEKLAECLRSIPGSTRVSTASLDKAHGQGIFNVRLISQKNPKQAFIAFKRNCLDKFRNIILKVEIGAGSIEQKGWIK